MDCGRKADRGLWTEGRIEEGCGLWTVGRRMRDHTKLDVFHVADQLVLLVYVKTRDFPKEEMFGLTSQMQCSVLSIPSNIVEGCARNTEADYLHFLDMAYGSAREIQYQISVAERLGYLKQADEIKLLSEKTARQLNALIRSLRNPKSL